VNISRERYVRRSSYSTSFLVKKGRMGVLWQRKELRYLSYSLEELPVLEKVREVGLLPEEEY